MFKEFKVKINKQKIADDIFHTIEFRRLVNQLKAKRRRKGIKDTFDVSDIYPILIEIANLIKNKHPRFIQEKQKILQKLKSINLTT
jgi:RNA polymerase-interacting CarD/CdnL/TRCF family regulator